MATRTPKAAVKKKAEPPKDGAKPAKASPAPKPAAKGKPGGKAAKAGGKPGKAAKAGAKGGKSPPAEEPSGWPEALDTVRAKEPSFFERLRQRRAEKAAARLEERKRLDAERRAAEERARRAKEEQDKLRAIQEAKEQAEREAKAAEAQALREAAEKKERAAARRAEAKAAREAERAEAERKAAEEAAAKAAAAEEAKAHRAAERQRKREELEAEERRLAEEQAARDAEAEVEARRLAVAERLRREAAEEAEAKAAKEPEPDLEFEEASRPVKASDALVPAKGGATAADAQAELMAAELAKRRSKPIVIVGDIPEPPKLPKAPLRPGEQEVVLAPPKAADDEQAVPAPAASSQPTDSFGFSLPEAFLLLANEGGWDERAERNREGAYGGALAGAMVLELLMRGQVIVQRDRIVLTGQPEEDAALAAIAARLRRVRERKGDLTSLQQMGELAKANRDLLTPFKQRLADRGVATHGSRRHLGLFHRSWVEVTDVDAQERLQNRLRRAIAGGGTPEAASILLLGLLDAAGLFATVVPDEAADYNRKRLNGLLGGRDIMGYKVDPQLKALQEIATRAVLNNVRIMTVRG